MYIKEYGKDLANRSDQMNKYPLRLRYRIFCLDCADFTVCKGKRWESCPYRSEAVKIVKGRSLMPKIKEVKNMIQTNEDRIVRALETIAECLHKSNEMASESLKKSNKLYEANMAMMKEKREEN